MNRFYAVLLVPLLTLMLMPAVADADSGLTGWRKGVNIQSANSTDFASATFRQSVQNAANDGANWISLVVPLSQSDIRSSSVNTTASTPTDQTLVSAVSYIHSLGLKASINIHDDPSDGQWRAMISPTDRPAWFASYGAQLNHFADVAQANRADELMIGTEMSSLTIPSYSSQNTPGWSGMIKAVRQHYSGIVTYDATHGGYMADDQLLGFWNDVDVIGISAYYSMGNKNSTISDMMDRWAKIDAEELSGIANTYKKPLIFTEAGYVSGDDTLGDPGDAYSHPGNFNMQIQADAYQAMLSYWSKSSYMKGVVLWDWSSNPSYGGQGNLDYTPQNKLAESVMKQWFTGKGVASSNAPTSYDTTLTTTKAVTTATNVTSTVKVSASQVVSGQLVDLEIYDANGKQVAQKFYENQTLTADGNSYDISWKPASDGAYTVKSGIFTANWSRNLLWNGNVSMLTATTPLPVATTPVIA